MNTKSVKQLLFITFLSIYFCITTAAEAALPPYVEGQALPSLAPMLERSMPAVVNISTSTNITVSENPLMQDPVFRQFFNIPDQQLRRQQRNSLGSGVIIDSKQGLVLTNNHVIDKADTITVTLNDGRQLAAKLIGTDPEADVAVIQIPVDNLTMLPIADSNQLKVGDFVVAIGNPFGLGQTVTSGIVSALGRSGLGIEGYEDFIQTDASINPGNSGGALVNLRGELVGMNTAIIAPTGGNVGIGFAIPSNMAMTIKESLVKHGEVRRGLLGVTTQDLTPELVKAFNLKNIQGAAISRIESNSPAAKAGLEPGDIIVSANGRPIKNSHDIRNIIGMMQIGDKVELEYFRGNEKKQVTAIIGKHELPRLAGNQLHRSLQGALLSTSLKNQIEGVLIEKVDTASGAWRAGLRPGDVIISANRYRVRSIEELKQIVDPNGPLLINIQRGQEGFFVVLK
ncbi:MAG: DegQ family serine endoprotease [Methylobacter sp.]|uniref:DegQ family serine endoprotease n=1 Tax=Methylobacter sp. TaxID=2051955 RepID=UPI002718D76D|nr:DegQ family serine endoprotease [Methylobacter sp.]MDO9270221.1 DegQ family serine endoprotease [Methylobacter sp.]MDP1666359.1 DegQ family serine endoprotease [Methylobacter sp.]